MIFILGITDSNVLLERLLPYVYKLTFIFTTSVTGTGATSNVWRSLAKTARANRQSKLTDNETADILQQEILKFINQYFESNFRDFINKADAFSSTDKLKKVLRQLEIILRTNAGADKQNYSDWYGQRKINCDHLEPKELAKNHLENFNMIGNATLLKEPTNKGLRATPFQDKKKQEVLRTSQFYHTRSLVDDGSQEFSSIKEALSILKNVNEINDDTIFQRTAEIMELFKRYLTAEA